MRWIRRLVIPLSSTGIVIGTVLLCASLTPSLLPRTFVMQGVLCGFSFAIGYLIGVLLKDIVIYLGLPQPSRHDKRGILFIISLAAIVAAVGFL